MKKVIYIVKSELHIYPPCIAQIRMLKKNGVDVEVWYGSCAKQLLAIFDAEGIPYVDLHEQRGKLPGKLDRLNNWHQFASVVKKKMKTIKNASQTLFWFGTAETAMPMVGKLKGYNYALTSLELLDDNKTKNRLFSMLTGDAEFIVCCETTRAFIMRNWYGLKKLPYVMPNKPYDFHDERRKTPSIEATKKAIELVQDKKFIIYQGILKSRDYMLEMARAIRDSGTGYYFVLMGLDPENIFTDINMRAVEAEFRQFDSMEKGIIDLIPAAVEAIKQEVEKKLNLFGSVEKAVSSGMLQHEKKISDEVIAQIVKSVVLEMKGVCK